VNIDYLWSEDKTVHAINNALEGASLEVGILCLISCREETIRISNENHSMLVEVPKEFRSSSERVKVFNALLNVLDHEQIQLPSAN
jgi:CRISPR/Cas system CMR-associated protein Cmr1 (group 7 of RAMP superfamily)